MLTFVWLHSVVDLSKGNETDKSKMLEGELQTSPAMTPSPSSSSTSFKKPEEKQSDSVPSAKLTPHSGSLSPLGEKEDSFSLRRSCVCVSHSFLVPASSFSSTWLESDHDCWRPSILSFVVSAPPPPSSGEVLEGNGGAKQKGGAWNPEAFKGFAHSSIHMESVDSQFGIVLKPKIEPKAGTKSGDSISARSSLINSKAASPLECSVKSDEVLSEVVVAE